MRRLQTRLLLAVGLLALVSELGVALALRSNTRREFLRYQEVERRASLASMATQLDDVAAPLDGTCCDTLALSQAAAMLPRQVLLFVFDASGAHVIASAGAPLEALVDVEARVRDGMLSLQATRAAGATREQMMLQVISPGRAIRLADGRAASVHVIAVPDPDRQARVDAFLGTLDRRLLLLTATVGVLALGLTWVVARSTVRPLAELRDAAAALGAGALDRRVKEEGPAEVVALARSFNTLAARLQDQHALRQHLTSDVAHELRTPLTALLCRLESVVDGVAADPVQACRGLRDDVLHLSRLVDDLQDLALAEARDLRLRRLPVRVSDAVNGALLATGLADATRVVVTVPDALELTGDTDRVRQVLVNLVSNAQRHAPADARITITARAVGDEAHLDVHNAGSTLPGNAIERVFERFYRVDASRQRETGGTGLGLAIVKQLVEAQGGRVWARNEGGGVTVGFALPRPDGPGAAATAPPSLS
jgi:two-component system sensor histidine kinase BaeS